MNIFTPSPSHQLSARIFTTSIPGLLFIEQKPVEDERGFFLDVANLEELRSITQLEFNVKQMNMSRSVTNVVRGMHAEDWNKLVTVISGVAFCALADLRVGSETFGKVEGFWLGHGDNALTGALFIPKGLANSVCSVQGPVNYLYAVDKLYSQRDPSGDVAISIFDPDLDIDWPIPKDQMIISQRDKEAVLMREKFQMGV